MPSKPIHPGKVLAEELAASGVTPTELARQIAVPPNRISQIIRGKRAITGDTALRLAHWFGTQPKFWMELQAAHDIRVALEHAGRRIAGLPTRSHAGPARRRIKSPHPHHLARNAPNT